MSKDSLYIVIPAYNESENIRQVIEEWYPIVASHDGDGLSRLVIIDDGSKDDTYAIMNEMAKDRPLFEPLTKPNGGHGATILYGYKYAISQSAKYIFQTDSDGQTRPSEFEDFWKIRDQYDMVIGWRNRRQDGVSRIFVTKVLKLCILVLFHVKVTDANTPFRLMESKKLEEQIKYVPDDFNLSNVLISVVYAKKGCKVKYLPITFRPRQGGVNSINLKKIFGIGVQAVKDFIALNKAIS